MKNPNWYYLCDLKNRTALSYMRLPEFFGNLGNMHDYDDQTLSDLSFVEENRGFMKEDRALTYGIDPDTMRAVREDARLLVLEEVREQRDHILSMTDHVAASDRWLQMDGVSKRKVTKFRQALRDITTQDVFHIEWPHIPVELASIKNYGWPEDINFSESLQEIFEADTPEETIEEIRADQWDRIQEIRDARISGGVDIDGKWFYTDSDSIQRYLALVIAGPALMPKNVQWKTMDGTFVPMTHELAMRAYVIIMQHTDDVYNYGEVVKAQMMSVPDPAKFDITVGWKQVYADTIA